MDKIIIEELVLIDLNLGIVSRLNAENAPRDIPGLSFSLLKYLWQNKDCLCSPVQIFENVWPGNSLTGEGDGVSGPVKREISNLRKILADVGGKVLADSLIKNKRGEGYYIDAAGVNWRDYTVPPHTIEQELTKNGASVEVLQVEDGRACTLTADDIAKEGSNNMLEMPGMVAGLKEMQKAVGTLKRQVKNSAEKMSLPSWAEEYFERCEDYYAEVTTSLNPGQPVRLKDVFICSDLEYTKFTNPGVKHWFIENAKVQDLEDLNLHTVIIGPGGMGKSMMMRHLFLDEVARRKRIPVLFSLVEYEGDEIIDVILDQIKARGINTSKEEIGGLLQNGQLVLFMDAFDEIMKEGNQIAFAKQSSRFLMKYTKAPVIMSCRELDPTKAFHQFSQIHLMPFSTRQMIEYVRNAGFSKSQQNEIFSLPIVRDIMDLLNNRIAIHQEEFSRRMMGKAEASTPLILSMILLAYRYNGRIDDKNFYSNVFRTMVYKHDEGKEIPVKRKYETGLKPLELEKLFAEFCYESYVFKGAYAFTEQEFYDITKDMNVDRQAFLSDLHERASMLVLEKNTLYKFVHRNFQQYYAAWYMCNHPDATEGYYERLVATFWLDRDGQIQLMLDISRPVVEEHIFIPYLRDILSHGYWSFMGRINPGVHLLVYKEKMSGIKLDPENGRRAFTDVYSYIMNELGLEIVHQLITGNFEVKGLSGTEMFVDEKDFGIERKAAEAINRKFGANKFQYAYDEYLVHYGDLDRTENEEILKCLEDERSVYKQQYKKFLAYYEQLKAKYPGS